MGELDYQVIMRWAVIWKKGVGSNPGRVQKQNEQGNVITLRPRCALPSPFPPIGDAAYVNMPEDEPPT